MNNEKIPGKLLLILFIMLITANSLAVANQCPTAMPKDNSWQAYGDPNVSVSTFDSAKYYINVGMYCFYKSNTLPFPGYLVKNGSFNLISGSWIKAHGFNGYQCITSDISNCQFNP